MRFYLPCFSCLEEAIKGGDPASALFVSYPVPFDDSSVYRLRCDSGHEVTAWMTQYANFELLAETAVQAIFDGYYREAVTSFAAALERFREFYIRAIAAAHKTEILSLDEAWRSVAQSSERQFGWYIGLYLRENGTAPPPMSNWYDKTRNAIVHKGEIPRRADAIRFGQEALQHLVPILLDLRLKHPESLEQLRLDRIAAAQKLFRKEDRPVAFGTVFVIEWITAGGQSDRTLEDCLRDRERLEKLRASQHLARYRERTADAEQG